MKMVSKTASPKKGKLVSYQYVKKTNKHQNVYEHSYLCLNWFLTAVNSMLCIRGYLTVKTMLGLWFYNSGFLDQE